MAFLTIILYYYTYETVPILSQLASSKMNAVFKKEDACFQLP